MGRTFKSTLKLGRRETLEKEPLEQERVRRENERN
jgi:hypothetical protein